MMSAREQILKQVEARRAALGNFLNANFFSHFTVETVRRTALDMKGRSALTYSFRVNVYASRRTSAPRTTLNFEIDVSNRTVLNEVRRELRRCNLE